MTREVRAATAIRFLLAAWCLSLAIPAVLQLAGLPYGFNVWQIGEDRVWQHILQSTSGPAGARAFWQINDRNPLSPWWYLLFKPLFLKLYWSEYLVHRFIEPAMAIATLLFLDRLTRFRCTWISLSAALLVLFWNFSNYVEQIMWNFQAALVCGIFVMWLLLRYIDSGRTRPGFLVGALVLYLLMLGTYSIYIGIGFAGSLLLIFRDRDSVASAFKTWRQWGWEVGAFAALTVIFTMIWYTGSRGQTDYFSPSFGLISHQALRSLRWFIWHYDYTDRVRALAQWMGLGPLLAIWTLLTVLIAGAIMAFTGKRGLGTMACRDLGWLGVILASIALPVVALESTSSVWTAGTRSRMLQEFFQPVLLTVVILTIGLLVQRRSRRLANWGVAVLYGVTAGGVLISAFYYNHQLVVATAAQRQFGEQLVALDQSDDRGDNYVVINDQEPATPWSSDALSDVYAQTLLHRSNVHLRFVQRRPPDDPGFNSWWTIGFGPTTMTNVYAGGGPPQSYAAVRILRYDGKKLWYPAQVNRADVEGMLVDWQRSGPIHQHRAERTCPTRLSLDGTAVVDGGWSVPEQLRSGRYATWMDGAEAHVRMFSACSGAVRVSVQAVMTMADDIPGGARLTLDGVESAVRVAHTEAGPLLVADFDLRKPTAEHTLTIRVPRTVVPAGGSRHLSIMVESITMTSLAK